MELKDQLKQVQTDLEAERAKGAERNNDVVDRLAIQEADILKQIMVELQARLATLPTLSLADLEAWKAELNNEDKIDTNTLKTVQERITELEQTQARVQTQEDKVQSIQLPYNFNELYDNSTANETIVELIQQDRRQTYADHNAEIEKIQADCREQLRAGEEREVQLKRQNDELQHHLEQESSQLAMVITDRDQARKELQQTTLDRDDAISKRDAAVREQEDAQREIERLNGHINDLRNDAAVGARNTPNVINANDKLDQLVKQSAAEKAARAIERWNTSNPDLAAPKLEVPTVPATFPDTQPGNDQVHNGDTATPENPVQPPEVMPPAINFPQPPQSTNAEMANEQSGVQTEGTTVEERVAALEKRVDIIWQHANIPGRVA